MTTATKSRNPRKTKARGTCQKCLVKPVLPGEYFDENAADFGQKFFEEFLHHFKGKKLAGKKLVLEDWQREQIIRPLFGCRRANGTRRFRKVFVFLPRKNGKTFLAAGLALFLMLCDNEPGAEVYCAAADKEQARILFDTASSFVEMDSRLSSRCTLYRNSITAPSVSSVMKVLSADADTKHGFNGHGILIDELHAHANRDLYDVLLTSTGQRDQPLTFIITTAGVYDPDHICYQEYLHAKRVAENPDLDPPLLPVIYEKSEKDPWDDPKTWHKANPGLASGNLIQMAYLEDECRKAKENPAYENTFRRLHLNEWTSQVTRVVPMDKWNECRKERPTDLDGRPSVLGVDMSLSEDLSAVVQCWPLPVDGTELNWRLWIEPHFWIPEDSIVSRERRDRASYQAWAKVGAITLCPGASIDHDDIESYIRKLCEEGEVKKVCFDPYAASGVAKSLEASGVNVLFVRQTAPFIGPAMKTMLKLIVTGQLEHAGHPVMDYCANNVAGITDRNENILPVKGKSNGRIDGFTATLTAISEIMLEPFPKTHKSVYESRGVVLL